MKFNIITLIALVFVLLGCATPSTVPATKPATISPPTLTPTVTPTPLPTMTPSPVKLAYEPISADNIDRLIKIKTLGFGKPLEIRYTSDGKKIVLVTREKVCYLDSRTLEVLHCIETNIRYASISDDAQTLAILNYDTLDVIDTASGDVLTHNEIKAEVGPQWTSRSFSLEDFLSPDGKYVLAAAADGLYLWNARAGDLIRFFEGLDPFKSYRFSADSKYLVISNKNVITFWSLETKSEVGKIVLDEIPGQFGFGYSFSPQGTYIAVSLDSTVHVYRISDQKHIWYWIGSSPIVDVDFSGDESLITIATHSDANLNVWNLNTGNIVQKFLKSHSDKGYQSVEISQDGKFISAVGSPWSGNTCYSTTAPDSEIYLWSVETGELIISRPRPGLCDTLPIYFSFSPDSQSFLYFSEDPDNINPADLNLFSMSDKSVVANLPLLLARSAVIKDENTLIIGSGDGRVFEMDILTDKLKLLVGETPKGFDGSNSLITIFALSSDIKKLAVGTSDHRVLVVDLQNDSTQEIWQGKENIAAISFSPDNKYLAFSGDGFLQIWDFQASAFENIPPGIKTDYLLYSPKNDYLITRRNDEALGVFVTSIWELPDLSNPIQDLIASFKIAISPSGDFFVTNNIYDRTSQLMAFPFDPVATFTHQNPNVLEDIIVEGMAVSPDNRFYAAWLNDATARGNCRIEIWDIATVSLLKFIPVGCARFELGGQFLIFSSDNTMLFANTGDGYGIQVYGIK